MIPLPFELYAGIMAVLLIGACVLLVLVWRADRRFVADANARIANVRRQIDALPPLPDDWRVRR
mgnify:CR=1 FL=1